MMRLAAVLLLLLLMLVVPMQTTDTAAGWCAAAEDVVPTPGPEVRASPSATFVCWRRNERVLLGMEASAGD